MRKVELKIDSTFSTFMIFLRSDIQECATIKSVNHLSILSSVIQGALSSYLERLHLGCGGGQDKFGMSVLQRSFEMSRGITVLLCKGAAFTS